MLSCYLPHSSSKAKGCPFGSVIIMKSTQFSTNLGRQLQAPTFAIPANHCHVLILESSVCRGWYLVGRVEKLPEETRMSLRHMEWTMNSVWKTLRDVSGVSPGSVNSTRFKSDILQVVSQIQNSRRPYQIVGYFSTVYEVGCWRVSEHLRKRGIL
jgi:hypothetical protein